LVVTYAIDNRRAGRPIRIVVADDHAIIRAGLAKLLESAGDMEVVGSAADGREAVEVSAREQPDVVLMDLSMPRANGVEATREISASQPGTRVLILTAASRIDQIWDAMRAGAVGHLLKDAEPDALFATIRAAADGIPVPAPGAR
jgi:DNA-binding NarL/FixJ family response regulator